MGLLISAFMPDIEEHIYRAQKRDTLRQKGIDPYTNQLDSRVTCHEAQERFEEWSQSGHEIGLAGRVRSIRKHGGSMFLDIDDGTDRIQLFIKKDIVSVEDFEQTNELLDIGDIIYTTGTLFLTKKEEKTLQVSAFTLLTKALLPLPEKWHGLSDVETRYRQRYLDLIANPSVKALFHERAIIIRTIREFFEHARFIEVDTPVLQSIPGGATARPFMTHHHALNTDMYLRVAPELYLKRLIVGGFERVFEIARCFRNEGIDHTHNPEFTQVEAYMAYATYKDLMSLVEQLVRAMVMSVHQKTSFEYEGTVIECGNPFSQLSFREGIIKYADIDIDAHLTFEALSIAAASRGADIKGSTSRAQILDVLFKTFVAPALIQPTFVIDYPLELSPLARKKDDNPAYTERFQLVIAGVERVNAFSELNDPVDQLERFKEQEEMHNKGDVEAQRLDTDYITALEHGMPPTAGLGMGIDRMVALLTNSHAVKEVLLFPALRPKTEE
ncbi:MAG: lysine--tRNA ligase [Chlamydiota bacterium]|nr:lysine--tRNA ligase [Chlamydiota bacterium]